MTFTIKVQKIKFDEDIGTHDEHYLTCFGTCCIFAILDIMCAAIFVLPRDLRGEVIIQ